MPSFFATLFENSPDGGLVEVAYSEPPGGNEWIDPEYFRTDWFDHRLDEGIEDQGHVFFGPALRKSRGSKKTDILGSRTYWVDYDKEEVPRPTLPPTYMVWSGHGWHLYWVLSSWETNLGALERANKILLEDVGGDPACWNANRFLRVPGTRNEDATCEIRQRNPGVTWSAGDIQVLSRIPDKTRHKIRTGDRRGYPSRSERDWAVVSDLIQAGADDSLIERIFAHQPVGDKVQDPETHSSYLTRTINKARGSVAFEEKGGFQERDDGYYVRRSNYAKRVSTFVIEPKLLLDGSPFDAEDAIVGDVHAAGFVWEERTFSRSAFTSVRSMDKEAPKAAWQWLGSDSDVRKLLPYLMDTLRDRGLPQTAATSVLGLHRHQDRWLFVGKAQTLRADTGWEGTKAPLVYLPTGREAPDISLDGGEEEPSKAIKDLLPALNKPEDLWPIVGWYAATPLKPALEAIGVRFPTLNVYGTKGSGKTTTILRVMMPLLGQMEAGAYDANTTRFVALSLLGSSNAVPIPFSEFRYGGADKFLRYILLAYDTGHDPRGRPDQTTTDYPLTAPFSVDGEDLISDPAAQERIIAVNLNPSSIAEGTQAYKAFQEWQELDLRGFARGYIQYCLALLEDEGLESRWTSAVDGLHTALPMRLPDRVRRNYSLTVMGIRLMCDYLGLEAPTPSIVEQSLRIVFDPDLGRAPIAADGFIEDIINAADRSVQDFAWSYDAGSNRFFFQFGPSFSWWLQHRRRQNRDVLGQDAILTQLHELKDDYVGSIVKKKGRAMYPVNMTKAKEAGLDIPDRLDPNTLEVKF